MKTTALRAPIACFTTRQPASVRGLKPRSSGIHQTFLLTRCLGSSKRASVLTVARFSPPKPTVELVTDAIPAKNELLSPKLNPEVRKRSEDAITRFNYRVTVGDVAAAGGLTLQQAEDALRALAADSLATLQVADTGEILYVFDSRFRDTIRSKSLTLRLEPVLSGIVEGAAYLGRVTFGTALITSIVVVFVAITVIASSGRDNNRNRGGGGGGGISFGGGPRLWFNMTDILWYWDPYYYRRRAAMMYSSSNPPPMSFLEAVFSFVFGDGDPNQRYDQKRWEAIGQSIRSKGGVVTAEELAPFLDLQPGELYKKRRDVVVDESYVLPVLARLGGHPEVTPSGEIVYQFESLQQTGNAARSKSAPAAFESTWQLTAATPSQKLGAIALGALNLVGVISLSMMLQSPENMYALARNGLTWVLSSLPLLQAYAATFFAIPLVRTLLNQRRNKEIEARNQAREEALRLLQRPDDGLQAKMKAAQSQAQRRVLSDKDAVFRSDKELSEQPRDVEADSFEARLERRASQRQRESR